jgi:ABC-type branched-subunit amino acid transport system substrate-binding protein
MFRRSRFTWALAALAILAGAVAFGCGGSDSGNGSDNTPSGSATAAPTVDDATPTPYTGVIVSPEDILKKDGSATKQAELKIGWMFEETGPPEVTGFGVPTGDGVKLAVKEINDAGGLQVGDTVYTIKLVEYDTKSTEQDAIAIAQQLVRDDKVKVIFGPATLGETSATTITQEAKVLHLCPCQEREAHALSSLEKAHGESQWAFQTLLPFSLLVDQGAKTFNAQWPDLHSMAFLCQNTATGHDICERTRDAYQKQGVKIIGDIQYFSVGTTDYRPFLTALRNQGDVDFLYNYDNPLNTVAIVRQALELGVGKLHLVTVPATLVRPLVGRELTVPVSAGAAPRQGVQPTSQKAADFFKRYAAFKGVTFEQLPVANFVSLMTYDYVYMVAAAMQQAETVDDTTAIAKKLEVLHYDGVAEDNLFFNPRHLAVHGTEPCVVRTDPVKGDPNVTIKCTHNAPPPEAAR